MGKSLLLAVAAISLATGVITMRSTRTTMVSTGETLASQSEAAGARSTAHSGLAVAESALAAELAATGSYTGPTEFSGPYTGGTYRATITVSGTEYTVLSEGIAGEDTSRVQRAYRFEATSPPPSPVPAFMAPAITMGNNLQIKNDFTVRSEDGISNAVIHANNDIKATAGTVHIDGFGHYSNSIDFNNGQTAEQAFRPVSNPDGLPVVERKSDIVIPKFKAENYAPLATRTTSGDLLLSGTVTLGTREAPVIWYIDGNVTTVANVSIEGYGVIMTRGNVKIRHHVRNSSPTDRSAFALYTGNDLTIEAGSLTLEGQFLVGNNLQAHTNTTLMGSIVVGNDFQTQGPFTNVYRPASGELTDPFWPPAPATADPAPAPTTGDGARLITVSTRVW